jgi:RNA-directed DNA polymerase
MTRVATSIGASSAKETSKTWDNIPWVKAKNLVTRLQMRIAKAVREGKMGKVRSLQRILTHSFYAKVIAVKRVTSNQGAKTPGVDNIIWNTSLQKIKAANALKRRGYNPLPLRRIYIPKKGNKLKLRGLSIPTMGDRAMQALWQAALEPIAEEFADPNSYGFRPKRSTQDAIDQCFNSLGKQKSAKFVLELDIKSCFDSISHEYLLKNIPMDKVILRKFLKAEFMEKQIIHPTLSGVPQGGVISPTITLMALAGLEKKIKSLFNKDSHKVNVVAYADDYIITGASKALLSELILPLVKKFLGKRGLEISEEKSKITSIEEGFDFLGFNIRRYSNGVVLTKPSKANVTRFLKEIKETIKVNISAKSENLILLLNPKIRGWANYYCHAASHETFAKIDKQIMQYLWRWMNKRHPNKRRTWIYDKYLKKKTITDTRFGASFKNKEGKQTPIFIRKACDTSIRRHIKIVGKANPYNPEFKEYFKIRGSKSNTVISKGGKAIRFAEELLGCKSSFIRA